MAEEMEEENNDKNERGSTYCNSSREMDYMSSLPEGLVSDILVYLKSPRDVCRSSAISWGFKSAADSDAVWDRYLPSDYREIISRSVSLLDISSKKHLYFLLADSSLLLDGGKLVT
ncbi:hypothetical protein ACSBR2_012898 [Camellia fascicularis]